MKETGASEEVVAVSNVRYLHRNLDIGLEAELIGAIGHYKDFLFEWGFLVSDFDVHSWVDTRPWNALDLGAVAYRIAFAELRNHRSTVERMSNAGIGAGVTSSPRVVALHKRFARKKVRQ